MAGQDLTGGALSDSHPALSPDAIQSWALGRAEEYRRLAIDLLSVHNNASLINRTLPVEMISEIFAHSWSAGDSRSIRVAHVCRRWRATALKTPRFWVAAATAPGTMFDFEEWDTWTTAKHESRVACAAWVFAHTKPASLGVTTRGFPLPIASALVPHAARLVELRITIMAGVDQLSTLRTLLCHTEGTFLVQNLDWPRLAYTPPALEPEPLLPSLEDISLHGPFRSTAPYLNVLTFNPRRSIEVFISDPPSMHDSDQWLANKYVDYERLFAPSIFRRLTRLTMRSLTRYATKRGVLEALPNLAYLEISGPAIGSTILHLRPEDFERNAYRTFLLCPFLKTLVATFSRMDARLLDGRTRDAAGWDARTAARALGAMVSKRAKHGTRLSRLVWGVRTLTAEEVDRDGTDPEFVDQLNARVSYVRKMKDFEEGMPHGRWG
ncbi:uncharacterized protein BXZ73DRAFT_76225 [Epithele typhae]|uniref:uncharacterized protein n=1 Tax=Epithele typhae TaxID=378194 RepID=UPI0020085386|nr:uncharacterized protein BXZ73DRAFT_76225 [Epithele typhae]KAH9939089.1 hypothetical protein BXZ73DRAFT_76225 [Epithele typhae]